MNKGRFLELFQKRKLSLPIKSFDKDVYTILKDQFEIYLNILSDSLIEKQEVDKVQENCNRILKAIEKYYLGNPVGAFYEVQSLMDRLNDRNMLILYRKNEYSSRFDIANDPLNLYRVRPIKEEKVYARKDIFHVPFSKRRYVSSSRFSIAGYPSLYLGTSTELSRIETGLKKKDKYIVSKFKLIRDLKDTHTNVYVLDLAIKPNEIEEFSDSNGIYNADDINFRKSYIEAYPLIAACSIMVEKKDKNFYPEYIVPQLLMQWLSKKDKEDDSSIYGIRYFTCRSQNPRIKGLNYVFPVSSCNIDNADEEYCRGLSDLFVMTEPIISTEVNVDSIIENLKLSKLVI